jgi:hypothetical protein
LSRSARTASGSTGRVRRGMRLEVVTSGGQLRRRRHAETSSVGRSKWEKLVEFLEALRDIRDGGPKPCNFDTDHRSHAPGRRALEQFLRSRGWIRFARGWHCRKPRKTPGTVRCGAAGHWSTWRTRRMSSTTRGSGEMKPALRGRDGWCALPGPHCECAGQSAHSANDIRHGRAVARCRKRWPRARDMSVCASAKSVPRETRGFYWSALYWNRKKLQLRRRDEHHGRPRRDMRYALSRREHALVRSASDVDLDVHRHGRPSCARTERAP